MTDETAAGAPAVPPAPVRGRIPTAAAEGAARFAGRAWAIEQVADWAANGQERFLIVVGEPGWGKSALVAWLAGPDPAAEGPGPTGGDAVARPVEWSAWHFCAAALGKSIDPAQFSASLSIQLATRFADYGYAIVQRAAPETTVNIRADTLTGTAIGIHTQAINVYARDAREVYNQAVREPLEAVVASGKVAGPIFIAVDGLDDALEFSEPTIVDLVASSADFPDPVRFLVTTRDEDRVLGLFTALDPSAYRVVYVSDPDDPAAVERNDADVRAHVETELATLPAIAEADRAGLVDALVELANGNFLVAHFLLRQVRDSGALPEGVPAGLYPLYDAYLRRVMPETAGAGLSDAWTRDYRPLLGALSVARPAAPTALIPGWLERDQGQLNPVLAAVGQVVEYLDEDGGSRRLYHRSLAEFLALAEVPGALREPRPNRYYVDPREQHERIVRFYERALVTTWGGDWTRADDYGLRQLVPHLAALHALTTDPAARTTIAGRLGDLALDAGYQAAQRERFGGPDATIEAGRLALEVSLQSEPPDRTRDRARRLADSWDPQVRILAARVLERLSAADPEAVLAELKDLVR